MPDHRAHRGPGPRDAVEFAPDQWERLRQAVAELSWLWTRGYAEVSSVQLVGDRHQLTARQRQAVRRCACSDQALERRETRRTPPEALAGQGIAIDGFNVLLTIEAALGGAIVLIGRDGSARDIAGVHGTFRRVRETPPALESIATVLTELGATEWHCYLDAPVSNSRRLESLILETASQRGWPLSTFVVNSPDRELARSPRAVATADAGILDRVSAWFPLARMVIDAQVPQARRIDLSGV